MSKTLAFSCLSGFRADHGLSTCDSLNQRSITTTTILPTSLPECTGTQLVRPVAATACTRPDAAQPCDQRHCSMAQCLSPELRRVRAVQLRCSWQGRRRVLPPQVQLWSGASGSLKPRFAVHRCKRDTGLAGVRNMVLELLPEGGCCWTNFFAGA